MLNGSALAFSARLKQQRHKQQQQHRAVVLNIHLEKCPIKRYIMCTEIFSLLASKQVRIQNWILFTSPSNSTNPSKTTTHTKTDSN